MATAPNASAAAPFFCNTSISSVCGSKFSLISPIEWAQSGRNLAAIGGNPNEARTKVGGGPEHGSDRLPEAAGAAGRAVRVREKGVAGDREWLSGRLVSRLRIFAGRIRSHDHPRELAMGAARGDRPGKRAIQ